ncbi:MAG: protein kinase [Sandaracinaceae bacterium]
MTQAPAPAARECPSCRRLNPADANFCAGCGEGLAGPAGGAFAEEESLGGADPLLGRVVADRYRIERLLGRGGMGVVYRVEHVRIGKLMAMKLLHGALATEPDIIKRFRREAEAVSKLDHPNTVQIFDFGRSEGMMFLVMEYLSGRDLGQVLRDEGPLPFPRVARIAVQIASSVQQAHERGIVHRDLKPENVMVLEGHDPEVVKVLDFGLAKLRDEGMGERSITRAGSILGTPYYMAPEHIRGEAVDARSDIYALGALIYKVLTGTPPFTARSPVGVLTKHLSEPLIAPSARAAGPAIPPEADELCLRAMAKDPRHRFRSMAEVRDTLLAYLETVGRADGLGPASLRLQAVDVSSRSGRQREVATRGDVDRYERRLRRRSVVSQLLAALLLLGAVGAGAWLLLSRPDAPPTAESEPNDGVGSADPLPPGVELRAYLGPRLAPDRGDEDVFVLSNPEGDRRVMRLEVSAVPNIDLLVEIYRAGLEQPLLALDSGPSGFAEAVPNLVVNGVTHYVRVRERDGRPHPTENVSDAYTIRWAFVDPGDDEEREVNDTVDRAEALAVGEERRGYVGWGGDRDVYCVAEDTPAVEARVSGVSTLDLLLEVTDGSGAAPRTVDQAGLGDGERSGPIQPARAGRTCVVVGAHRPKDGPGNDAASTYTIRFVGPSAAAATVTEGGGGAS